MLARPHARKSEITTNLKTTIAKAIEINRNAIIGLFLASERDRDR
jgi:hypothetical protein